MKVLLIDDHPLILTALQNVIQGIGNHVSVVGVGGARAAREALAAETEGFDLMLLDLRLGDADGFELLAERRAAWPAPCASGSASPEALRSDPSMERPAQPPSRAGLCRRPPARGC